MYSKQVQRQYNTPPYEGRRPLDFSPFEEDLAKLDAARLAALDCWLPQAGVPQLQQSLQRGELTARELALYCIQRIKRYSALNAVLELNPDALEIAASLDAARRAGQPCGPLQGIPILLKDNVATADRMHTTAGAKAMESARAPRDSFVAARLRAAGALLLGKANMSEWANYMTTRSANGFSDLGGQARNPYGKFDVSGSSSGSAAAVAAGLVSLAVGSETCGSLISPGSDNSLAVLKPSLGLVSRDLVIPITAVTDTLGPMARSVTDLAILMHAIAGPDPNDPITLESEDICAVDCTTFLDSSALDGMRVGFVYPYALQSSERQVVESIREGLIDCGAALVDLPVPHPVRWNDIKEVLDYGMLHDVNRYLEAVKGYAPVSSLAEIVAFNAADLPNRAPFGQDILEHALANQLSPEEHAALAQKVTGEAAAELLRLRREGQVDVLVSLRGSLAGRYAIAGYPALTVPAGYRQRGEPVGLTFVGEHFEDGKLIAAAYAFEQATHARVAPKLKNY